VIIIIYCYKLILIEIYKLHTLKAKNINFTPYIDAQTKFQKLLKSIAEFKETEGRTSTNRGKVNH
jgi:hypothetical protein